MSASDPDTSEQSSFAGTQIEQVPGDKQVYRINEAAEFLNVSTSSVRRLIARGELRVIRKLRHLLVPRSELERFLEVED